MTTVNSIYEIIGRNGKNTTRFDFIGTRVEAKRNNGRVQHIGGVTDRSTRVHGGYAVDFEDRDGVPYRATRAIIRNSVPRVVGEIDNDILAFVVSGATIVGVKVDRANDGEYVDWMERLGKYIPDGEPCQSEAESDDSEQE